MGMKRTILPAATSDRCVIRVLPVHQSMKASRQKRDWGEQTSPQREIASYNPEFTEGLNRTWLTRFPEQLFPRHTQVESL